MSTTVPVAAVGTQTVSSVGLSTLKQGVTAGFAGLLHTVLMAAVPTCTVWTLYAVGTVPKVPEKLDPATVTWVLTDARPWLGETPEITGGAGAVWPSLSAGQGRPTAGFATGLLISVPGKKLDCVPYCASPLKLFM